MFNRLIVFALCGERHTQRQQGLGMIGVLL